MSKLHEAKHHINVKVDMDEHVGSTSVKGLAAKPIIDIDVVVKKKRLTMLYQLCMVLELFTEPESILLTAL